MAELKSQLQQTDLQRMVMPNIESGQMRRRAGIIGGAAALISADYMIDQNTLHQD